MIKDARQQAESIFLDANGKITNVAIAKRVEASHFTVGKWKKEDEWTKKLAAKSEKREQKTGPRPPRKKGAHDQALNRKRHGIHFLISLPRKGAFRHVKGPGVD